MKDARLEGTGGGSAPAAGGRFRGLFCGRQMRLVASLLLLKSASHGLLSGVLWLWNDFDLGKFQTMMARWPREGPPMFASRFATWDAAHYLYLSEVGYHHDVPSCAFYPLWPLLVRWSSPLFGGSHSISNLWNVPKFVIGFFCPTQWHEFRGSVLDRSVFILLLYCLPALWRLDKELLVWIYILGVLPAMSGTFTSFTRFASCAFPLFIALGVLLSKRQWISPRYALLSLFVVLHVVLLWRFVNFRWAG